MKIYILSILFLSFFLSSYAGDIITCVLDLTKLVKIVCPDGTIRGDRYNDLCVIVHDDCPTNTPPPPPPPPSVCYTCPPLDNSGSVAYKPPYLCENRVDYGGPVCNKETCQWVMKDCVPYVYHPREGFCPYYNEASTDVIACLRMNDPCKK